MRIVLCPLVLLCCVGPVIGQDGGPNRTTPTVAERELQERMNRRFIGGRQQQAILMQANQRHLFGLGHTVSSRIDLPASQGGSKPAEIVVAVQECWIAIAELVGATFRFAVTNRAFLLLGALVAAGVFRLFSERVAVIKKRRELRGLLGASR